MDVDNTTRAGANLWLTAGGVSIGTVSPQARLHVEVIGSGSGIGVRGTSTFGTGVWGETEMGYGVHGQSMIGYAVRGDSSSTGALEIANCSSSLRYKTDVRPFLGGLEIVHRLRPIALTWKQGGMPRHRPSRGGGREGRAVAYLSQ